jgi:hypothetical protein
LSFVPQIVGVEDAGQLPEYPISILNPGYVILQSLLNLIFSLCPGNDVIGPNDVEPEKVHL